jgi:tRNA(adenine34) deaminase
VSDEDFMRLALEEAERALAHDDVPVGAVVVKDGTVVAAACNERERTHRPTAHAEMLALESAARALGTRRLVETTLYVTLEPCAMCAGALMLARVSRLVYGPQDPRAGAALSLYNIPQDPRLNHRVEITTGVLADDSAALLRDFFRKRRPS